MKLNEIMPDPSDIIDPDAMHTDADAREISTPTERPRAMRNQKGNGKNRKLAKTIANLARMKARATNPTPDETSHQYNMGGHNGINWR